MKSNLLDCITGKSAVRRLAPSDYSAKRMAERQRRDSTSLPFIFRNADTHIGNRRFAVALQSELLSSLFGLATILIGHSPGGVALNLPVNPTRALTLQTGLGLLLWPRERKPPGRAARGARSLPERWPASLARG
jgi:hypothetical protein